MRNVKKMKVAVLSIVITMLATSCTLPQRYGLVREHYSTIVKADEYDSPGIPVTIRVNDLESDPPSRKYNGFSIAFTFIPIISFIPIENVRWTNSADDLTTWVCIGNDEIERIIVGELGKSGIVKEVTYRGEPKDYDIRGRVNFVSKWYGHTSGLGIFYCAVLPAFIFPAGKYQTICEAHFEVVSLDGTKVLLSKDYIAEDSAHIWIFYNTSREWTSFGTKVFPKILRQFIADLKAIPPSEWIKPIVKVKL